MFFPGPLLPLAAETLALECPKLGTLALGFQWLLENRVMPLAASLQLLSLWRSCGLISQQWEPFREVRVKVEEGGEVASYCSATLFLRDTQKWKFQGPE